LDLLAAKRFSVVKFREIKSFFNTRRYFISFLYEKEIVSERRNEKNGRKREIVYQNPSICFF